MKILKKFCNGRIQLKEYDKCLQLSVYAPYDLTDYPYAKKLNNMNTWKIFEHTKNGILLFGEYDEKDFDYMLESYIMLVNTYKNCIDKS